MIDYSKMTETDFNRILESKVAKMTPTQILSYGEIYAFLREELNNEVLQTWEEENPQILSSEDA